MRETHHYSMGFPRAADGGDDLHIGEKLQIQAIE